MNPCPSTLFIEKVAQQIVQWLNRDIIPFSAAMIIGLFSHLYAFTNKLASHDETNYLFTKGATTSSGRWGLELTSYILPDISMPLVYGLIALVLFSVAACLIIDLFQVRSKLLQVLLASSVTAFPALTGTVIYMFTLAPYAISFLLCVAAVQYQNPPRIPSFIISTIFMILSLSIYQAYISISASLLILLLVQQVLRNKPVGSIILCGLRYLLFLIVSLGLYYFITSVMNHLFGVSFNSYATDNLGFSLSKLPSDALIAYRLFINFFTQGIWGINQTSFSQMVHIVCLLMSAALVLLWMFSSGKKSFLQIGLLIFLFLLLPLSINSLIFFVSSTFSLHTITSYGFIAIYILAVLIVDNYLNAVPSSRILPLFHCTAANIIALGLAMIVTINVYTANATYLKLHMHYENAYAFYTSLLSDLKTHPEFDGKTQIAICGEYPEPYFYWDNFYFVDPIIGSDGIHPGKELHYNIAVLYLGIREGLPFASEETVAALESTEEFKQMSCYPFYGSTQMIDGVLVVKLSDEIS